ncbi:hypothetical protein GCM10025791_45920 [Halioxenophilus aromaticivorans]|uniref:tRNA-uridine aminocarboxypropyltransferase n=1 Tax=Halioxenophilus aromaticivorans TaxID=1306992 RepID=A0AAV3U933_9ALTE
MLNEWLALPNKSFARHTHLAEDSLASDCAGLIALLAQTLAIEPAWGLSRPRAVHYYNWLQEVGSNVITNLKPGNLLAWRKDRLPKSGDTGHVLVVNGEPQPCADGVYRVRVFDSSKVSGGLALRDIELHCQQQRIVGVRFDLNQRKIKRTAIYHYPMLGGRYCFGCALPRRACNCGALVAADNTINLAVLRHPQERKRTLSTVSLIKQRYPAILVKDGEVFDARGFPEAALLFPEDDTDSASTSPPASEKKGSYQLLLIDGTWRKAKKILHLNPWLMALPKVSLEPAATSDYLLRKVQGAQMLSSVEACALAVGDDTLAASLRPFMEKQIALLGRDVYQKNYAHYLNFQP